MNKNERPTLNVQRLILNENRKETGKTKKGINDCGYSFNSTFNVQRRILYEKQ